MQEEGQSIRALFDMSCESLSVEMHSFFIGLGVFAGEDFTLEAAAAVNNVLYTTAVQIVGALSCRSLVHSSRDGRYQLHPLLHDYVREKLTGESTLQRMAIYFFDFASKNKETPAALETEINNILIALDTAFSIRLEKLFIQGVLTVFDFLETHGLNEIAWKHLSRAADAARAADDIPNLIIVLNYLGRIAENRGNYGEAERCLNEGLILARQQKDNQQQSQMLLSLGQLMVKAGDYDRANNCFQEGLNIVSPAHHLKLYSSLLRQLGILAVKRGDYDRAEAYYQKGLSLAREASNLKLIVSMLQSLGSVALRRDAYDQAARYYQEGLILARDINYQARIISLSSNMGVVAFKQGHYEESENYYQEALNLARTLGYRDLAGGLLQNLGEGAARRGHYGQAEAYFKDALVEARAIGYQELIITLLDSLASLAVKHDANDEDAVAYLEEALTLAHNMENRWLVGHCLYSYGQLKIKNAQWLEAQTAFEQVLEIGIEVGVKELEAKSRFGLARVALAQKNITKAFQEGQQSLNAFDSINHFQAAEVANWLQEAADAAK